MDVATNSWPDGVGQPQPGDRRFGRGGGHQNGTFAVSAGINERGEAPFPVGAAGRPWWWIDECDIAVDRAGFVGRVSDDGRFISLATFDDEQMAGIAIRDRR